MYDWMIGRLAGYEGVALLGLLLVQYLLVLTSPALVLLGFGVWNPFLVLAGLFALRLLVLCCAMQKDVTACMAANEKARPF